jgi:uncharacterized membrane protein
VARNAPKRRPAPLKRDWVVASLAAAGAAVSTYLAILRLAGGTALFCESGSACDIVQGSRYGVFLGLPTAAWGALLYVAVGTLAVLGLSAGRWLAVYVLSVTAVAFSGYLTYLEVFVLRALCPYCLAAAGLAVVLLGAVIIRRPPGARRRPARLGAIGVAAAVVTIVVGAGIHAGTPDPEQVTYQEALARHLAATGAIMYGAYW